MLPNDQTWQPCLVLKYYDSQKLTTPNVRHNAKQQLVYINQSGAAVVGISDTTFVVDDKTDYFLLYNTQVDADTGQQGKSTVDLKAWGNLDLLVARTSASGNDMVIEDKTDPAKIIYIADPSDVTIYLQDDNGNPVVLDQQKYNTLTYRNKQPVNDLIDSAKHYQSTIAPQQNSDPLEEQGSAVVLQDHIVDMALMLKGVQEWNVGGSNGN